MAVAVLALQAPLLSLLLHLTDPGEEVADLSSQYFRICVWGVPAQLGIMAMTGWFLGMQNTRVPMAIAIGVNAVNIGLNVLLGLTLGYGIAGVAMGTVISNWIGAFSSAAVCFVWIKGKSAERKPGGAGATFRSMDWISGRSRKVKWRRFSM